MRTRNMFWVNWEAAFYHHQSAVDAKNLWGHQTVAPESCQQKHPPHFYANRCVLVRPPASLGADGNNRHGTVRRLIINHTFVFVRLKRHSVSISHTHRDTNLEENIQGPKLLLMMMESIRSLHTDVPHDLTNISVRCSLLSRCPSTQDLCRYSDSGTPHLAWRSSCGTAGIASHSWQVLDSC